MQDDNFKFLVEKFADGRPLCNCREAYYTPCGKGIDSDGKERDDMLACQYGCDTNKIVTKYEIATRVMEQFGEALRNAAHR